MDQDNHERRSETISIHLQFSISKGSVGRFEDLLARSFHQGTASLAAAMKAERPVVAQTAVREVPVPRETSTDPDGMINVKTAARLLSISTRQVYKLMAMGRFPKPASIGRSKRWSAREIRAWMDAGCPPIDHRRGWRGQ